MPADLRLTDAAGLTLGMRWTPLDAVGLYVPGRQGGLSVLGADERHAGPRRRRGAHRHVRAGAGRRAQPAGAGRRAPRRGDRDLPRRRRPGGRGAGLRHRQHRRRSTASSAPATPMSPKPSARCSAVSASTPSPARPRSSCWPTPPTIRACVAVDLLAQAEHDEAAQAILITDDAAFADAVAARGRRRTAHPAARRHRRGKLGRARRDHRRARLGRGGGAGQPPGAGAPAAHAGRPRAGVRPHPPRRRGVPRPFCPEAVGDYVAGPNHVLPTGRTARFASGLSVFDFLKRTTWVQADAGGAGAGRPRRRDRWPRPKGCRRTRAASRCGWAGPRPADARPDEPGWSQT